LFSEACSTSLTYWEMVMVAVQLIPWLWMMIVCHHWIWHEIVVILLWYA
jgi:hypothetical protein